MTSALKLARKLHDTFGRIPDKEAIAIALELKDQVMIESAGEPVAWHCKYNSLAPYRSNSPENGDPCPDCVPLYTHPQASLSDAEIGIEEIWDMAENSGLFDPDKFMNYPEETSIRFAREIEAQLKEQS